MARPGVFISLEGGEGSGKSTQLGLLKDWFASEYGQQVVTTREPGGTPAAERIRQLLVGKERRDYALDGMGETLLLMAARRDHVQRVIKPALDEGRVVICDRFIDSTHVYQSILGGVDGRLIDRLGEDFLDGISPDITILFDIDPRNSLWRSMLFRNDDSKKWFTDATMQFHLGVRDGFLARANQAKNRFIVIDASQGVEAVHKAITAALGSRLKNLAMPANKSKANTGGG